MKVKINSKGICDDESFVSLAIELLSDYEFNVAIGEPEGVFWAYKMNKYK